MSGGKKYWIGLGIGAGLLALFFVTGDWRRLGDALAQANYWYIVPAIALYQLSVVLRTMRWQVSFLRPGKVILVRGTRAFGLVR